MAFINSAMVNTKVKDKDISALSGDPSLTERKERRSWAEKSNKIWLSFQKQQLEIKYSCLNLPESWEVCQTQIPVSKFLIDIPV